MYCMLIVNQVYLALSIWYIYTQKKEEVFKEFQRMADVSIVFAAIGFLRFLLTLIVLLSNKYSKVWYFLAVCIISIVWICISLPNSLILGLPPLLLGAYKWFKLKASQPPCSESPGYQKLSDTGNLR